MKKTLLTLVLSFFAFIAFSQISFYVTDSIGYHDCDSSQVFIYNNTQPQTTFQIYYQWQINGVVTNVGTSQAPFETWVSNNQSNFALLYAYSDPNYQVNLGVYTHVINTDTCGITDLLITANQDSAINCSQGVFTINASPFGGVAPYSFIWTVYNSNNVLLNTYTSFGSQFTQTLDDGSTVEVTVSDSNGSSYTDAIQLNTNSNITVTGTFLEVSSDCTNTTFQFDATTNIQTTLYLWEIEYNGIITTFNTPTPIITVPNSAQIVIASVTVYDLNNGNCSASNTVVATITANGGFNVISDVINTSTIPCIQGQCDFEILLTPTSGTGPYLFALDSGILNSSNVFTNICPGQYMATVEDATGCSTTLSVYVADVLGVQVYENSYFSSCDSNGTGGNNSFIQAYASGANTVWSDGTIGNTYQNPAPGTYTYIVTDPNTGCTASGTFIVPSNNCYTISGNVYADLNGDCIFNNNDYALNSVWVDLTDAAGTWLWIYDYTTSNGAYSITAPAGTYYFDINGNNVTNFTQTCPASGFSVTIGPNNPNPVIDFYMTPPPPIQDLSISLFSFTTFTPGFPYWAYISYCNPGTTTMSGTIVMNYDANLTYVTGSSAGAVNDSVNNTLIWTFTGLNPSQCSTLYPDFVCSTSAVLGTTMSNTVVVNPIIGDVTPTNNTAYVIDTVVGSWDPNDKAVYPQAGMTIEEKNHDYTIRFQNKGTAPATLVVVRDDLDDNLDLQSLRNVSASHNFVMTIENTDELVFTFNNIMLPAEQDDLIGSNGDIHFTITQKDNLPIGTVIENTAGIYFDFNEPVITNTTINTIIEKTTDIGNLSPKSEVVVYPNPSIGLINIIADTKINAITVYNLIGKEVFKASNLLSSKAFISLKNSADGVYLIKTETETGIRVNRITLTNN